MFQRAKYCEYGPFEEQAFRDLFISDLTNQRNRDKAGNIGELGTVVQIAKNYESSTDVRRLMRRQARGDQVNWTEKNTPFKSQNALVPKSQ